MGIYIPEGLLSWTCKCGEEEPVTKQGFATKKECRKCKKKREYNYKKKRRLEGKDKQKSSKKKDYKDYSGLDPVKIGI